MTCPTKVCEDVVDELSVSPSYVQANLTFDFAELPQTLDLVPEIVNPSGLATDLARVKIFDNTTNEYV